METQIKEPEFIKLYFTDISKLYGLSKPACNLFLELIQLIDYNPNTLHNVITITSKRKRMIFESLGWSEDKYNQKSKYAMYSKYIRELMSSKLITRIEDDIYLVNPDICGKTSFQNLQKIKSISLNITYEIASKTLVTLVESKEDFLNETVAYLNEKQQPVPESNKVKNYLMEKEKKKGED